MPTIIAAAAPAPRDVGGPAWRLLGQLAPGAGGPTIAALASDPTTATALYAGALYSADNRTGVFRSDDGGQTWKPAAQGLPTSSDGTGVAVLAVNPQRPTTVYAIGHFAGVWRSDDRGEHWKATGLATGSVSALALDPRAPDTLYALTQDGPQRSADGGATWQALSAGLPERTSVAFTSLVLDPAQPDTLYLGASFGGIFRSADAGRHWSAANAGLPTAPVLDGLFLDGQTPHALFANITGEGFYRSTDSGARWRKLGNEAYAAVTPASNALYAITEGTLVRSADQGASWHAVAAVACGVQALAPTAAGGVVAGCLDGGVYLLQSQPTAQPPPAPSSQQPSAAPTAAQMPGPTATPAAASADAKSAVLASARALGQAGPYHIAGTISTAKATSQISGDVVPPDRLHYTMNTPDGAVEFITIGERSYTKAKGSWIAIPASGDALQGADPLKEALLQTITAVAYLGTDSVNGVAAQVYTYTTHTDDLSSTAKLWVSTANSLPIKIETDSQVGGVPAHGSETITYDPRITIEAPLP